MEGGTSASTPPDNAQLFHGSKSIYRHVNRRMVETAKRRILLLPTLVSSLAFVITKRFVARLVCRVKTLRNTLGRTAFPPFC
jgi:hypothetical protein